VDEPTGSTKSPGAILDDAHASVRSEAEDERPSPAASNPTLSATSLDLLYQALEPLAPGAEWPIECPIRPLQAHSRSTRSECWTLVQ